jgi:hypothetical protein
VLYELLTARRLFKGTSDFLTMSQIVAGNIPDPSQHRPDLPPALAEIVKKALALSPDDRYQTADELRVALDQTGARSSTSELADYMKQIFGHRVEPWLVEDDDPDMKVDIDFDGQITGVAESPDRILTPPPGSLLARARRKAAPGMGVPITNPEITAAASSSGTGDTGTPTPMAWSSETTDAPKKRKLGVFVGALGAVAIAAGAFVVLSAKKEVTPTAVTPAAGVAKPEPAPAKTPEPAPPPKVEAAAEPAPVETEPKTEPVVETPAPVTNKTTRPAKKGASKKTAKKTAAETNPDKWDPTKLLPD